MALKYNKIKEKTCGMPIGELREEKERHQPEVYPITPRPVGGASRVALIKYSDDEMCLSDLTHFIQSEGAIHY